VFETAIEVGLRRLLTGKQYKYLLKSHFKDHISQYCRQGVSREIDETMVTMRMVRTRAGVQAISYHRTRVQKLASIRMEDVIL
jgi:hypothetical protein